MVKDANKELWLRPSEPQFLVFGKPRWIRALAGFALLVFATYLWRVDALSHHNPWAVGLFAVPISLLLLMFSYVAGPDDIAFDLGPRTYRQRIGFVWLPRTRSGTISDVTGFLIQKNERRRGRALYHLCLVLDRPERRSRWRNLLLDYPQIGIFGSRETARHQAQWFALQLGVPCRVFRGTNSGVTDEQAL